MALGEHLGADEDARLAALDGAEQVVHGVLACRAVAVHTQDRVIREQHFQAFLGALGAGADRAEVNVVALRALLRQALVIAAMVAAQHAGALVYGHARIAARAFGQPAAVVAQQGRGETAAVEENQHLLACLQGLADGLLQWAADAAVQWQALHIQTQHPRRAGAASALVHAQQAVAAGQRVVQGFQ